MVGMQLADALDHLHRRWIMHRDVKPANVIYDGSRAVLIDFHLAKEPGPMRGGAGTRLFTAPEQVQGGHVTTAADIWGLGTVLYRAVTGRLPFHADRRSRPHEIGVERREEHAENRVSPN